MRLITRNGLDWTDKFGPEIVEAFRALPVREAAIDGELVVDVNGASNFSALQAALSEGRTERLTFYAFDLLYLDGYDLTGTPLIDRKEALRALVGDGAGALRFSDHFEESGELVLRHACRLGLEGVISKDARFALSRGARPQLAQVQVFGAAGVRDRRLHRFDRLGQGDRFACARRLRGALAALCRPRRNRVQRRGRAKPLCAPRGDADRQKVLLPAI